ncbi:monooxygenase [Penicillium malachiteum]|uniref:monooxygenase n=1 Tax=Penicillium malachiteum TaxID=1324776 RepID=UPI002546AE8F|nr:monooxygenase [Penicillium malachiteum]KAJ5720974.1 monooxygenase [Penicillium malachiteum]
MKTNYDVIISGAGPVGLMLATELQLHGANVLVLEKRVSPDTSVKAGGINTASVEALERRGLLPAIHAARGPLFMSASKESGGRKSVYAGSVGHFGGINVPAGPVDKTDPLLKGRGKDGWYLMIPQVELEKVLFSRALELGVTIWRGVTVQAFQENESDVAVQIAGEGESRGEEVQVRGKWLVGCDGGHSLVRRLAGFEFLGTDPKITGRAATVEIEGGEDLRAGWQYTSTGVYVYGAMPGRVRTVEFDGPPADKNSPVTAEEMESSLRRVSGVDTIRITGINAGTRFTDNARQANTYQRGRVFLCGDAAHVHSPFSGQGLNLGIGDAVNLGWKLAAVACGRASEDLLETYTRERHPIGTRVLDWTRAQVAVMRGDPDGCAMRGVMTDLLGTGDGATHYVKQISGLWQRYDFGDEQPLVGMTMPDIQLADGSRLVNHFHKGHAVLMDLAQHDGVAALAKEFGGRLKLVRGTSVENPGIDGLFIRPDGVVAWAAKEGSCDIKRLKTAMACWLRNDNLVTSK